MPAKSACVAAAMADWLFDLGNSRLKFAALRDDGTVGALEAMAHDGTGFDVDGLRQLPPRIANAHVASVAAPAVRDALLETLASRGARVTVAATQPRCAGVAIAYAKPGKLGVDRFLSLLAAHARGGAWLVAGVGTALTVDLVDADGRHFGGRIAPSPMLMREALHARAAQLPAQGGAYREFADDTEDALASGCLGAAVGLVERSLCEARAAAGGAVGLLLHGGGSDELQPHFAEATVAPALVLEGLACWARANGGG